MQNQTLWLALITNHFLQYKNNNLKALRVSQNNNLVTAVKFCQNTWRISLVCHINTNRMMTSVTLNNNNKNYY
jgi:hypothetical protein